MIVKCQYHKGRGIAPVYPDELTAFKSTLDDGDYVSVDFEPWSDARSRAQQGLFHEVVGRWAASDGVSALIKKLQVKYEYGVSIPASLALFKPPRWSGKFVDLSQLYQGHPHELVFLKSEADYTKREHWELDERTMHGAEEAGVDIADIRLFLAEKEVRAS